MELEVTSKVGKSNCQADQLYTFLSDFRNIKKIIPPEQSEKFEAQEDSCTIQMNSYAAISLHIVEREAPKLIKIGSQEGSENMTIWVQLKETGPYDTRMRITVKAKANLMTKWVMKKQLQKFADSFVDGLCQIPPQALSYASQI